MKKETEQKPFVTVKIGAGYPLLGRSKVQYEWVSDAPGIAYVSSDGIVSGISVGQTTVHRKNEDGEEAYLVRVIPAPVLGRW